jgi:two-component system nitrate/nitrite response regulator NarL
MTTTRSLLRAMLYWQSYVHQQHRVRVTVNSTGELVISDPSFVRILVVEDFGAWRDYIVEKLRENPRLRVVDFAADGLEAVRKAQEVRPDLILLDIGLPGLSGIEAARQIRRVVPESKIIFMTAETSAQVAEVALRLGAEGYVLKIDVDRDLLVAVEAVMSGERFVSEHIDKRQFPPNR